MNLTPDQITSLKDGLSICKVVGIDAVVFADGRIMGANDKKTAAIFSDCAVTKPNGEKIGVGRISELLKRIELFDEFSVDAKGSTSGDIVQLSLTHGRTKAQYRCTSTKMIPHPKENLTTPLAVISVPKEEGLQLVKALRTFNPEMVLMKISGDDGGVLLECVDSTNDQFSTTLSKGADFVEETGANGVLFTYSASSFITILDAALKDSDSVDMVLSEEGFLTFMVKNHSVFVIPTAVEEE